jgi:hypothetical protein
MLGHFLNNEVLTVSIFFGTGLILLGLLSFEWDEMGRFFRWKKQK